MLNANELLGHGRRLDRILRDSSREPSDAHLVVAAVNDGGMDRDESSVARTLRCGTSPRTQAARKPLTSLGNLLEV